jgi:hypothetical protein
LHPPTLRQFHADKADRRAIERAHNHLFPDSSVGNGVVASAADFTEEIAAIVQARREAVRMVNVEKRNLALQSPL